MTDASELAPAVREMEERYRRIVEAANEGIWILDADDRITYVNSVMARMIGFAPEEILGRSVFDFYDGEQRQILSEKLRVRRTGVSESYELRMRRRDGADLWVLISASPLVDDPGKYQGALALFVDITAQKESEMPRRSRTNSTTS